MSHGASPTKLFLLWQTELISLFHSSFRDCLKSFTQARTGSLFSLFYDLLQQLLLFPRHTVPDKWTIFWCKIAHQISKPFLCTYAIVAILIQVAIKVKYWQSFRKMMQFIAILVYCSTLQNMSRLVLYRAAHSVWNMVLCKLQLLFCVSFYLKFLLFGGNLSVCSDSSHKLQLRMS